MNLLLDSINNFFTAIVQIYPQLPYQLTQQIRTMQAFLKGFDQKQLFLIQNFVRRLQAKASALKYLNKKKRDQLKTQPNHLDYQENKQNLFNLTNVMKGNSSNLINNGYQDKAKTYRMIDGIKLNNLHNGGFANDKVGRNLKTQNDKSIQKNYNSKIQSFKAQKLSINDNYYQNAFNFSIERKQTSSTSPVINKLFLFTQSSSQINQIEQPSSCSLQIFRQNIGQLKQLFMKNDLKQEIQKLQQISYLNSTNRDQKDQENDQVEEFIQEVGQNKIQRHNHPLCEK